MKLAVSIVRSQAATQHPKKVFGDQMRSLLTIELCKIPAYDETEGF